MKEAAKLFYSRMSMYHKLANQRITELAAAEEDNYHCFELSDTAYVLRETIAFLEDNLKQMKKLDRMTQAKCGAIYMTADYEGPIKTEYCTATVKIKEIPELPKLHRDPERYAVFMDWLGIPKELTETDMIRLNWKMFMDFHNKRIAEGKRAPAGLDVSKTVTTAELKIRKKKDIEYLHEEK